MIVLDTTVLVYAVGTDHALRGPCRDLLAAVGRKQVRATTTPEVIQEFVHVRARRRDRHDAAALGRRYAQALAPLCAVTAEDLHDGLELFEAVPALGCFDAVLAAVARHYQVPAIASADRGFADVDDLQWLHPSEPGFLDAAISLAGQEGRPPVAK